MLSKFEAKYPWIPYVLPMAVFMAFTMAEGSVGKQYPVLYIAKVICTVIVLFLCKTPFSDLKFDKKWLAPSVVLGLALLVMWVAGTEYIKLPMMSPRTAYNPFAEIENATLRAVFLAFRFTGLALIVPIMEEIFWRSFGLRVATKNDWQTLPIGEFSNAALLIVSGVFAAAHPEWWVALAYGVAIALWMRYTKSLFACIVMHATTNLALGIYVVTQGAWKYW